MDAEHLAEIATLRKQAGLIADRTFEIAINLAKQNALLQGLYERQRELLRTATDRVNQLESMLEL